VVSFEPGPFVRELEAQTGLKIEVVPVGRFRNLRAGYRGVRRLAEIIRRDRIQLVHCNGTGAHIYGGLAARLCGVPSVFHVHDVMNLSWSSQGLLHLAALAVRPAAFVPVSHYVARGVRGTGDGAHVRVVHNAVWRGDGGDTRDSIEAEGRRIRGEGAGPLVVWCGRLQRWKGAHVFVKAAARVAAEMPSARFLVVGGSLLGLEEDYAREVRELAESLGLGERLRFVGHQEQAAPYLAAGDVVAHTSVRPDSFGLVVFEAMSLGRAVVAADDGGPAELVEPEVTGLLYPPGDDLALARAVMRLLRDEGLRRRVGAAALERVRKDFRVEQMMQKLEGLYRDLVPQCSTR
jgi:glycosyltransferase involved in cell wall biosynthesis